MERVCWDLETAAGSEYRPFHGLGVCYVNRNRKREMRRRVVAIGAGFLMFRFWDQEGAEATRRILHRSHPFGDRMK